MEETDTLTVFRAYYNRRLAMEKSVSDLSAHSSEMTPLEQQIKNLLKAKELHAAWNNPNKGAFPAFDKEQLLESIPPMLHGNKPTIDLVPRLSNSIPTFEFIVDVWLPHVYEKYGYSVWVWNALRPFGEKIRPVKSVAENWQGGVQWVQMDLERYAEADGHSAQSVRKKGNPLASIEPLVHFAHNPQDLMSLDGSPGKRSITIPGFEVKMEDSWLGALCVYHYGSFRSLNLNASDAGARDNEDAVPALCGK